MELKVIQGVHNNTNLEIVPVIEDKIQESQCPSGKGSLSKLVKANLFNGKFGEVYLKVSELEEGFKYTVYLGMGKEEDLTAEKIRVLASKAVKKAVETKEKIVHFTVKEVSGIELSENIKAIFEGAVLSLYKFDKYKTDKKENNDIVEFAVAGLNEENITLATEVLEEANVLIKATYIARDLVNEPANVMYPGTLAEKVVELGKDSGFEVEVFGKSEIEELNMKAYLEVSRASAKEPKLIVMRYFGDAENKDDVLALVGKGLTYDSGGYSIKPTNGMASMKSDMGGAASVIGAITAIAEMKIKKNVIAVVAACENMISGDGYRPGDIISSMAGKTIEVLNTDAEGRLTLIDAVHYAITKENASKVIDVATLTGAAIGALGNVASAVVTNNEEFYTELVNASKVSGEKFWQLPAFPEYKDDIKSDIADYKNIGGAGAGTITAGLFIGEFVGTCPWIHIDIAPTAFVSSAKNYLTKGGTGVGVRSLYYLTKSSAQ